MTKNRFYILHLMLPTNLIGKLANWRIGKLVNWSLIYNFSTSDLLYDILLTIIITITKK